MNFNIFSKKEQSPSIKNSMYVIATELVPYRLNANKINSLILFIRVKNITKDSLLTSLNIIAPSNLGFNENLLLKQKQINIGELLPNNEKELKIEVFGNTETDQGEYTLNINTIAHFRDYSHVINSINKSIILKVIK